ncbi:EamA family transporter RarD [Shewanella litorisediminis]|uniref:EamA family transporter RarD n=1 Tax=Shewanella litorisediminis TaxID=1173586 RepID=A0ABX7G4B9_9GAMM|nr:EamA family transporter RarD [Shewanella litorisediminis]MCL2919972.1 EamA family transporter RarD [Shewanella litorisediminis]QRH02146.1 EamA family transporter RarD [Shewanella litorisediminis]
MNTDNEYRKGILLAIGAYTMWGFAPLYFKLLEQISATDILLHRVIWSFVFTALLMVFIGGFGKLRQLLKARKQLLVLLVTSILIAGNWLLFIWAVNNDHMLDASLGYYINPLLNVLLGMVFLGERLRPLQWFAVFLATIGVAVQVISFGSIPVVSLALAGSFGIYGLLRKKVKVDAKTGLLVETAILMPVALGYLLLTLGSAEHSMLSNDWQLNLLLMAAGIVTTAPLLCFAGAAVRIPLSMLGFFQYIGPSIMFILAVSLYGEPFGMEKSITFGFIWTALAVFTLDMLRRRS